MMRTGVAGWIFCIVIFLGVGSTFNQEATAFRDCAECPEMVAVPAGSFMMGSPDYVYPMRHVKMPHAFALGKYEVTFAEWEACVAAGACKRRPDDEGWGRGNRPVINVSWEDAKEYVHWLSKKTRKQYRLPSEAEWEYATRAGTDTRWYWGKDPDAVCKYENVLDRRGHAWPGVRSRPYYNCDDGYATTAPVGSYPANDFGLHDMLGNVTEWVQDCYNPARLMDQAPTDGSAWTTGECWGRILRGGSWLRGTMHPLDSATRGTRPFKESSSNIGFRVAMTLKQGCSKKEQTLYEGMAYYRLTPAGWWMRCDGKVDNRNHLFFPQIHVHTPEVSQILAAIGCPTNKTWNYSEIWNRLTMVWSWLQNNQLLPSDANYNAANMYITSLGHWPSLAEIAHMYVSYGGIYWSTCMSRAQLFATLLYAVGVPSDRFAIAEAYWKPTYSQHMYVIVYLNRHWIYIDPTFIGQNLSNLNISSVGGGPADYIHPRVTKLLPGSKLMGVPLVE